METSIHSDCSELVDAIRLVSPDPLSMISIDGVDGVGKSTLARQIAEALSIFHVEVDFFVQKHMGGYIDYIDYDRLGDRIDQVRVSGQGVVVEGICIQQVLKNTGLDSNLSIYVKQIDGDGFWMDQFCLFPPIKAADQVIKERKAKGLPLGHTQEIIQYHYIFRPHEHADFVFVRQE